MDVVTAVPSLAVLFSDKQCCFGAIHGHHGPVADWLAKVFGAGVGMVGADLSALDFVPECAARTPCHPHAATLPTLRQLVNSFLGVLLFTTTHVSDVDIVCFVRALATDAGSPLARLGGWLGMGFVAAKGQPAVPLGYRLLHTHTGNSYALLRALVQVFPDQVEDAWMPMRAPGCAHDWQHGCWVSVVLGVACLWARNCSVAVLAATRGAGCHYDRTKPLAGYRLDDALFPRPRCGHGSQRHAREWLILSLGEIRTADERVLRYDTPVSFRACLQASSTTETAARAVLGPRCVSASGAPVYNHPWLDLDQTVYHAKKYAPLAICPLREAWMHACVDNGAGVGAPTTGPLLEPLHDAAPVVLQSSVLSCVLRDGVRVCVVDEKLPLGVQSEYGWMVGWFL